MAAQGSAIGGAYLKFPLGARVAALGEAVVADPSSLSSGGLNPANFLSNSSGSLLVVHNQWIQEISQQALVASLPLSLGTFAFSATRTGVADIPVRSIPGPAVGSFTSQAATFAASFATAVTNEITIGGTGKYIYEKIFVDEATGYAADLGVLYRTPIDGLTAGASVTNLGSLSPFRSAHVDLPRRFTVGASYRYAAFDLDHIGYASILTDKSGKGSSLFLGVQSSYEQTFAARVGYQTGIEARGLTLGLGAMYSVGRFDYAFVPFSAGLGSSHIISLEFVF